MANKKLADELIDRLIKTGLQKNLAITLVFIAEHEETQSRTIEDNTRLRQPEVSIATNELQRRGWIKKRDIPTEGRGRPVIGYSMEKPIDEVIEEIEKQEREKIEEIESNIKRIKEIKAKIF
ncbi:MAG: ArsR family transcriptional regulator [Thermoplasmata archaeon]